MSSDRLPPRNDREPVPLIDKIAPPPCPGTEVSVLLDQEKSTSIHLNSPSVTQSIKERLEKNMQRQEQQSELSEAKQVHRESYNTWKARNAHALQDITGSSLERTKSSVKQAVRSPKVSDVRRPQTISNEHFYSQSHQHVTSPQPAVIQALHDKYTNHVSTPRVESYPREDENLTRYNTHQQNTNNCQSNDKYKHENCYRTNENPYVRDIHNFSKLSQNQLHNISPVVNTHKSQSKVRDHQVDNVHPQCNTHRHRLCRDIPEQRSPNYRENHFNQDQCDCNQVKVGNNPTNAMELANRDIALTNIASPLNIAHVNNQSVMELYNMIHLQNEQILMLQQQIKQIHLQLLQIPIDNERFVEQKIACLKLTNDNKNDKASKDNCNCNNNKSIGTQTQYNSKEKTSKPSNNADRSNRSAMTSNTEDSDNNSSTSSEKTKTNNHKNQTKSKKKVAQKKYKSPSHSQKEPNKKKLHKEKEKKQHTKSLRSPVKKTNKKELEPRSKVETSFSLDESKLVERHEEKSDDDTSSEASIEIDMPDYLDSNESDNSESSSDTDESGDSGTETEESSEPQPGWTFYNGVVGQVNNILQRNQSPSRNERLQMPKRTTVNQPNRLFGPMDPMYQTGDMDTGVNWSKRVTFNGPPPEDSDNIPNMVQMPWFQQSRPNQPYRTNGGAPGRMQDFMMFNIANGNTNHSFSTLRFLERYDHVSSLQKGPEIPDYLFQENKKSKSKKKKKSKTTNHDMFSHVPQQNHSRKHY
ncbi:uncharacterized protein DDB_G0287625-like [Homalodisca vitripennis]|uniref:uncharacterized protein DDB_G0287625-like n=1 Tax=Homalodisca vitripennis TaxID=197043 RepID=UPI001EEC83F1|nr:uncharacterized protein DDB_G0287625-like [Homalodisca vitripennis]XP_046669562.1 uncharacterized protein DDB_G0287625-like [Homalodisca vitripennis]